MQPAPEPEAPSGRRQPIDTDPDRVNAENPQTDQDIDTAGTEADEPAIGSALDRGIERDERRRPAPDRP
jgi:hypothetical protein